MHKRLACLLWLVTLGLPSTIIADDLATQALASSSSARATPISPTLENDAQEVLTLIEESTLLRNALPTFVTSFNQALATHHGAIPAEFSLRIANAVAKTEQVRDALFKQALKHRSALYRTDQHIQAQEKLYEIMIAMAAATTLYENHDTLVNALKDQPLLQKKLNESYAEYGVDGGFYNAVLSRANHPEYRKAMTDAIQFFKQNQAEIQQLMHASPASILALHAHIAGSPVLDNYAHSNAIKEVLLLPQKATKKVVSLPFTGLKKLTFQSSRLVGNTLGLVKLRQGKFKHQTVAIARIEQQLQPGDILLEKTPFTLTDKTIPGHFGHAAIYLGSAEQLRALGLDTLPEIAAHWSRIEAGASVAEALRDGVQLNSFTHFMNVDDVAVLRAKELTPEQLRNVIQITLSQLGKRYDFNFDVNTTETIVCSELVYLAYPQIDFVTKRVLKSFTISPDDIAIQAGEEAQYPLTLVLFGHDGSLSTDPHAGTDALLYASLVRDTPSDVQNTAQNTPAFFQGFVTGQVETHE